jgi:sterol desaturase/sphingolipid hydroxylase (fatty acid hydroxylase superfamily)
MNDRVESGSTSETAKPISPNRQALPALWAAIFLAYLALSVAIATLALSRGIDPDAPILFGRLSLGQIHQAFFRYAVVGLLIVPGILVIEWRCVGWQRSSLRALLSLDGSTRSDLVFFVLNHLRLFRWPQIILTFGIAMISGDAIRHALETWLHIPAPSYALPAYVAFPWFFFLYTIFDYLAHRVDHSDLFWPLHRFHHAAQEFTVFTADRGHPASAIVQIFMKIFPLTLLGVTTDALIDIGMMVFIINYLNHSRIDWDFGWFGRWVVQSPLHHQFHHSIAERHSCNLSLCPLWDRLGGTWRDIPAETIRLGTTMPYRHGFNILPDLARDYRDFLQGVWRCMARAPSLLGRPRRAEQSAAHAHASEKTALPLVGSLASGGTASGTQG